MLYAVFCSLDGRELYSCPDADMLPEEKRAMKKSLAEEFGLASREIYIRQQWRW